MSKIKVAVCLGIVLLLIISSSYTTFSSDISDFANDVTPNKDFPADIDLISISVIGNSIVIVLGSNFSLPISGNQHYLVLFASDGWENWDGAIALTATPNITYVNWKVENLEDTNPWNTDYSGNHYQISNNTIKLIFLEYNYLVSANIATLAIASWSNETFYDWAPNSYENYIGFNVFLSLLDGIPIQSSSNQSDFSSGTNTTTSSENTASTAMPPEDTISEVQPPGDRTSGTQGPNIDLNFYFLIGIIGLPIIAFLRRKK